MPVSFRNIAVFVCFFRRKTGIVTESKDFKPVLSTLNFRLVQCNVCLVCKSSPELLKNATVKSASLPCQSAGNISDPFS